MSIRLTIFREIEAIAAQQGKAVAPLTDDLPLLEAGLDSLAFAMLMIQLEDLTGCHLFKTGSNVDFPRKLGDLVALFEEADVAAYASGGSDFHKRRRPPLPSEQLISIGK